MRTLTLVDYPCLGVATLQRFEERGMFYLANGIFIRVSQMVH